MPAGDSLRKRKIAVLGARSVGKSSLVVQFAENHFVESYYPTIETTFFKTVKCNNTEYDCEVIDTSGQDEYSILNAKHAIGIHGFVLVYSVTSKKSFDMIQIVYDKITDFCGVQNIPCVIVGSKTDLQQRSSSRQVTSLEGEELARSNKAAWVETSAKNNTNVSKVFELCCAEVEKLSPSHKAEASSKGGCTIM